MIKLFFSARCSFDASNFVRRGKFNDSTPSSRHPWSSGWIPTGFFMSWVAIAWVERQPLGVKTLSQSCHPNCEWGHCSFPGHLSSYTFPNLLMHTWLQISGTSILHHRMLRCHARSEFEPFLNSHAYDEVLLPTLKLSDSSSYWHAVVYIEWVSMIV